MRGSQALSLVFASEHSCEKYPRAAICYVPEDGGCSRKLRQLDSDAQRKASKIEKAHTTKYAIYERTLRNFQGLHWVPGCHEGHGFTYSAFWRSSGTCLFATLVNTMLLSSIWRGADVTVVSFLHPRLMPATVSHTQTSALALDCAYLPASSLFLRRRNHSSRLSCSWT